MKHLFILSLTAVLISGCHTRTEWSDIFVNKGLQYRNQGEYDDAIKEAKKALDVNPKNLKAFLLLADVFWRQGKKGPVIEKVNKATLISEDIPAVYYFYRGDLILRRGACENWGAVCEKSVADIRESIRLGFNKALQRDPENGLYYFRRARAYELLNEKKEAERDMQLARQYGYEEEAPGRA